MEWKGEIRFGTSEKILHFARAASKREREREEVNEVHEVNEASWPGRLQKGKETGERSYFESTTLNTWSLHPLTKVWSSDTKNWILATKN